MPKPPVKSEKVNVLEAAKKSLRAGKIKHPVIRAEVRAKHPEADGPPLTSEDCQELIGWTTEPEGEDWGKEFLLKDRYNRKVRLTKNTTNRPFRKPLAERYAIEHLRGKWSLNLETLVFDKFGLVLQGQHRLVSFILAEQTRLIDPVRWGKTPLAYEVLVGYGVSPKPENANTYDLGAKRFLDDVLYLHQKFGKGISEKDQKKISKILSGAVRLAWLRAGGKQVSFAPHFPHSEAIEFYGKHPKLLQATEEILALDHGETEENENLIKPLLSLSYASALHYLMSEAKSWGASKTFWKSFAETENLTKGSPILVLRNALTRMTTNSGGSRDEIIGMVIKAWLAWNAKETVTAKDIKVARKKVDDKFVLAEFPRIGGIDSEVEVEVHLSEHQNLILSLLSKTKGTTFAELQETTSLQQGVLTNAITQETKSGKVNPNSLEARGLVILEQTEAPEGGDAPISIKLKK